MNERRNTEAMTLRELAWLEGNYRRLDGSPWLAWEAIALCLENNMSFPDWVADYLLRSARSLLEAYGKSPVRPAAQALGFSALGSTTVDGFEQYLAAFRKLQMAIDAELEIANDVKSGRDEAWAVVAQRHGVAEGEIQQVWEEWSSGDRLRSSRVG
ncbi:MAG: hypothetical protein QF797_06175 [Alphaproteobacteria bacterium]|nr:hypothetical protein [Alphaproteobacteria bacterium]